MEDCIMKKTMRLLSMTALALMGAMMTGCSEDDNIVNETPTPQPAHKTVTLTTTVSMDGATTRALDADGKKTFAAGDQIAIIYEQVGGTTAKAVSEPLPELPEGSYNNTAMFTVTLTDPKASGNVRYIYPAAMAADAVETSTPVTDASTINYTALALQDGTLASLAANLDFAMYDGKMTANAELPDSPELDNQLVVCAFDIKKDNGDDITSSTTCLTIIEGSNTYNVTRTPVAGPIYVAMRPVSNGSIVFDADTETDSYNKTMPNKTLEAGKLYPLGVKLNRYNPIVMPLTFEAKEDGATVTCTVGKYVAQSTDTQYLEYSTDGGVHWTRQNLSKNDANEISVRLNNKGAKVMFRGDNKRLASYTDNGYYTTFSSTGNCYFYGNVMSLLYPTTYATETSLPDPTNTSADVYTFCRLFMNATFYSHSSKRLSLTATGLKTYCYQEMFWNCPNLTTAPDLPATTLTKRCYRNMFYNCENLTTAPVISATELAEECCIQMFNGCSNLTKAPDLLAVTPAKSCYNSMFGGCLKLNSIRCYLNPDGSTSYTKNWLNNVASSGEFIKNKDATWPTGSSGIPSGWTGTPVTVTSE